MINLDNLNSTEVAKEVEPITEKVVKFFRLQPSKTDIKAKVGNKVYYESHTVDDMFIVLEVDVNSLDTFALTVDHPKWVHVGIIKA